MTIVEKKAFTEREKETNGIKKKRTMKIQTRYKIEKNFMVFQILVQSENLTNQHKAFGKKHGHLSKVMARFLPWLLWLQRSRHDLAMISKIIIRRSTWVVKIIFLISR